MLVSLSEREDGQVRTWLVGQAGVFALAAEHLLVEAGEAVVLVNNATRLHDNMDERQAEST